MSARIVKCPVPQRDEAERIGRTLVEERLAACAQVMTAPIVSIYRWQGKMQRGEETLLLLKTDAMLWPALRDRLEELHPYDVPEILSWAAQGTDAYVRWLGDELSAKD